GDPLHHSPTVDLSRRSRVLREDPVDHLGRRVGDGQHRGVTSFSPLSPRRLPQQGRVPAREVVSPPFFYHAVSVKSSQTARTGFVTLRHAVASETLPRASSGSHLDPVTERAAPALAICRPRRGWRVRAGWVE